MIPQIDRQALAAYLAAVKDTPDAAIVVQFLPRGLIRWWPSASGKGLSDKAAALAQKVRGGR